MTPLTPAGWYASFDMLTSLFIILMVLYIYAYVMTVTWIQAHRHFNGIEFFFLNFFLHAMGLSVTLLRGRLPDGITIVGGNTLMFCGNFCLLWGMARFMGLKVRILPYAGALTAFIALYTWYTLGSPDIRMRIIIFSGFVLSILLHTSHLIFFRADADHKRYAMNTGVTLILFSLVFLLRICFALGRPMPENYFNTPMPDTVLLVMTLGLLVLLTHSLHLMINGKLLDQSLCHQRELEEIATRDGLTGLYNRRKMDDLLKREFSRFQRKGHTFTIVLADVDLFKSVNDSQGHDAGDAVLVALSTLLEGNIRVEDGVARWGGEEFLLLLPETDQDGGRQVAEKLRQSILVDTGLADATPDGITMSFGVAQVSEDLDKTLKQADQALYRAKSNGRNRVEVFIRQEDNNKAISV